MGKLIGTTYVLPCAAPAHEPAPDKEPAEMLRCPACDKEYKTQAALDKHLTEKHPDYVPDAQPPAAE